MICVVISMFLCILTYPGILYTDSYERIRATSEMRKAIHAFAEGEASLTTLSFWVTIIPSFFILLSQQIVGSIVIYTFCQCFLFFFLTYILGDNLSEKRHVAWNRTCITLTPVLWAFGVYYEASIGCVAAIMGILLLIWKWDSLTSGFDKAVTVILLIFSSFICFGYRANAFTIIPAIIIIVILKERKVMRTIVITCSIIIGFMLTLIVPKVLNIDTMSSHAGAFVWEMISTIQVMDDEKQTQYIDYLDDIFGEGVTAVAVKNNTFTEEGSSINSIWWGNPFESIDVSEPDNTKQIVHKYFHLIKTEPGTYIKVKWEFVAHSLGLNQPLRVAEYYYNRSNAMMQFGFNDCRQRQIFVDYFLAFIEFMVVFRIPWIMFLTALILILVWRFRFCGKKSPINLYEATYAVSVFYYGAYLLNTQSFEFRYYFPSWLLLLLIIISIIADMCFRKRILKRLFCVLLPMITIFVLSGAYLEYVKVGDETVKSVMEQDKLIYANEGNSIYYGDGKLYFITSQSADEVYTYFLHYNTIEGNMINNDFDYKSKKLATSFWKQDVVVMEIPKQEIESIEFGQYYGDTLFWKTNIGMESIVNVPQKIYVSDYSDSSWNAGYSNDENCFLVNNVDYENYYIRGKRLKLQDGTSAKITDVELVENYIRIYTDIKLDDASVREYQVVD